VTGAAVQKPRAAGARSPDAVAQVPPTQPSLIMNDMVHKLCSMRFFFVLQRTCLSLHFIKQEKTQHKKWAEGKRETVGATIDFFKTVL
jgi:hypothetical protein